MWILFASRYDPGCRLGWELVPEDENGMSISPEIMRTFNAMQIMDWFLIVI